MGLFGREPLLAGAEADFVAACRVAHLATVMPGGGPHVVPICPVLDLDRIVFASEAAAQKVTNLRLDPAVSLVFDDYLEDWDALRQVVVWGKALILERGFEFERDRNLLYEKFPQYGSQAPILEGGSVCVEVRIERVSSSGFP